MTARAPDPLFANERLAATYDVLEGERADLDAYERIVDELAARSVLDVGCGTGVLACRLAGRGAAVTAVDPAAASLRIARAKPGADAVTWIAGDAASVPPVGAALAMMTGNVAQVFVTDEEWLVALDGVRRALRVGGHFVFEARDPSRSAWERWTPGRTRRRAILPSGESFETWCEVVSVVDELVSFRWTTVFDSDATVLASDSTLRFRPRGDVERSLVESGFEVREVRDAPDRPGEEMVFVARLGPRRAD